MAGPNVECASVQPPATRCRAVAVEHKWCSNGSWNQEISPVRPQLLFPEGSLWKRVMPPVLNEPAVP
jgi:hypothetical protein